jgi:hypothetical protein
MLWCGLGAGAVQLWCLSLLRQMEIAMVISTENSPWYTTLDQNRDDKALQLATTLL